MYIENKFLEKKKNKYVKLLGWIKNKRYSNLNFIFLTIFNGKINNLQVVISNSISNADELKKITIGSSVEIEGILLDAFNSQQGYELYATRINIIGLLQDIVSYPISPKKHSLEFLRNNAHLRSRTQLFCCINKIRNNLFNLVNNFLFQNEYYWVPSPMLTTLSVEDDVELFSVVNKKKQDFFKKPVSLSVSGQLHLEAISCAMSKVYCFGPVFRAENSDTNKHLAEFWMLEVETAFMKLEEMINFIDSLLKFLFSHLLSSLYEDIVFLEKYNKINIRNKLISFLRSKLLYITYDEAIEILLCSKKKFSKPVIVGSYLTSEHELYLSDIYFKQIVAILYFPMSCKAFYMKNIGSASLSVDIIFPGIGEIIGGSEREENFLKLKNKLIFNKMNVDKYSWYLDLRKFGTVFHSGFGLGFERLLMYVTGMLNIRDVVPFPRARGDIKF